MPPKPKGGGGAKGGKSSKGADSGAENESKTAKGGTAVKVQKQKKF